MREKYDERTIFQLWINIRVYRFTILKIYHSIKIFNRNEFKYGNKLREIKKKFRENSCGIRVFFFRARCKRITLTYLPELVLKALDGRYGMLHLHDIYTHLSRSTTTRVVYYT